MPIPVSTEKANTFAKEWIDAWSSHDVFRILSFCSNEIIYQSPLVAEFPGHNSSDIRGIKSLGAYWTWWLNETPDLYFYPPEQILIDKNSICLMYQGAYNLMAVEILIFDSQGLVILGECQYRELAGDVFGQIGRCG